MLALRLPKDLEERLDALAKRTGRTKSYYARQAIVEHLSDLEDLYLAERRMREDPEFVSLDDVIANSGVTRDEIDAAPDY